MEADKKWYVIHTYSGYENKVKTTLELKVQSMGLQDVISRILVPLEDEIDEKDGVKKVVKPRYFLGMYWWKWKLMTVLGMLYATRQV